jgi:hypothetical protein
MVERLLCPVSEDWLWRFPMRLHFRTGVVKLVRSKLTEELAPSSFSLALPTNATGEPILDATKLPMWQEGMELRDTDAGWIGV